MTGSHAKDSLRLAATCTFALLLALGGGAAFAHHADNGHKDSGNNDKGSQHASSHGGDWGGDHGWHHRRHHHKKSAGLGPVHGPGSSHNPIVYHPVHGPGSSHNPVIVPVTVVRDHRQPPPRHGGGGSKERLCREGHLSYCAPDHVRDHRTPAGTQCLGDLC